MADLVDSSWPATRRWIRASMVMSLDGSMVDVEGRSGGLSTPEDSARFLARRRAADVILVGAGTVRAEGYRPQPRPMAVVSNSGFLPADSPLLEWRRYDARRPTIYTTQAAVDSGRVDSHLEVVVCGDSAVDLRRMVADFAERGWARIVCEGGPTLLRGLLEVHLLDEVCLSIVPMFAGTMRPIIAEGVMPQRFTLAALERQADTVFLRLLVHDPRDASDRPFSDR
jgi:riboflavin biosynthesis pyrimidine reductase